MLHAVASLLLSATPVVSDLDAAFDDQASAAESAAEGPRPFDQTRDAAADIDAALAAAARRGTRGLFILGGNWCHDSRGLAAKFQIPELAALISERYELVYVDVGRRDRNLAVARRFGVGELLGTPTILIVSAGGALLNQSTAHDWSDAASRSFEETLAYFEAHAK